VASDVGQRFLHDAVRGRFGLVLKPPIQSAMLELYFYVRLL